MTTQFDIVIPAHEKDKRTLEFCIKQARKKIVGARRIIVISKERYSDLAEFYSEKDFPFSFDDISNLTDGKDVGWHYQQFLKMYALLVIPDLLENILVLDSDTVFIRKVKMFDSKGRALFNYYKNKCPDRNSFDLNIVNHIKKLYPEIAFDKLPPNYQNQSAVCHHMIFNRDIMKELITRVEDYHFKLTGIKKEFYELAMQTYKPRREMELSEYQIYFNYIAIFHPEKLRVRSLKFKNSADQNIIHYLFHPKYHYCSFHHYLRGSKVQCRRHKIKNFIKTIMARIIYLRS